MNVTGQIRVFDLLQSRYAPTSKSGNRTNCNIAVIVTNSINSVSDLPEPHLCQYQVSHHPPVSACHAESKKFTFWQGSRGQILVTSTAVTTDCLTRLNGFFRDFSCFILQTWGVRTSSGESPWRSFQWVPPMWICWGEILLSECRSAPHTHSATAAAMTWECSIQRCHCHI